MQTKSARKKSSGDILSALFGPFEDVLWKPLRKRLVEVPCKALSLILYTILVGIPLLGSASAVADGVPEVSFSQRNSWKFGAGIGVHPQGDSFFIDFTTPVLFEYEIAGIHQKAALTWPLGFYNLYNQYLGSDGRYEIAQSYQTGLVLEPRTEVFGNLISVFSRLGWVHQFRLDPNVFDQRSASGFQLGIGIDFAFMSQRKFELGGSSTPSVWLAVLGQFGFPRASVLNGRPEVLNGFQLLLGLHNHF